LTILDVFTSDAHFPYYPTHLLTKKSVQIRKEDDCMKAMIL